MAGLCGFLVIVQFTFIAMVFWVPDASRGFHPGRLLLLPLVVACIGIYEYIAGRQAGWRIRQELGPLIRRPLFRPICEAALPSIGIMLFAFATDWPTALRSPPVFGYFIILMLSMLSLDVRICVMVGLLEAGSSLSEVSARMRASGSSAESFSESWNPSMKGS